MPQPLLVCFLEDGILIAELDHLVLILKEEVIPVHLVHKVLLLNYLHRV